MRRSDIDCMPVHRFAFLPACCPPVCPSVRLSLHFFLSVSVVLRAGLPVGSSAVLLGIHCAMCDIKAAKLRGFPCAGRVGAVFAVVDKPG
jgi:hypothetical protein